MRIIIGIVTVLVTFGNAVHLPGQNVHLDYFRNVPRQYSADDPWNMGELLSTQVGHNGFFYNCDQEECKRNSPWIMWNQQPAECQTPRPVRSGIMQQLAEIKQRISWGSCGQRGTRQSGSCDGDNCDGAYRVQAGYDANGQPPGRVTDTRSARELVAILLAQDTRSNASNRNSGFDSLSELLARRTELDEAIRMARRTPENGRQHQTAPDTRTPEKRRGILMMSRGKKPSTSQAKRGDDDFRMIR